MIGKLQLPCDSVVCVEDPSEYYLIRWGPEFCRHNQSKPMEMITTQVVSRTNKSFIIEATMLAGLWNMLIFLSYSYFLIVLGSRRALSTSGVCCFPVSIRCCCNQSGRGARHCPRVPASSRRPAPQSKTKVPEPSTASEKKVRVHLTSFTSRISGQFWLFGEFAMARGYRR